jgi:hypothetical protein
MARSEGLFTDLMEASSRLKPATSVVWALVTGLGFHVLAWRFPMVSQVAGSENLGHVVIQDFTHVASWIFQFLMPAGFLLGLLGGMLRRRRGR